jgi:membrane protein
MMDIKKKVAEVRQFVDTDLWQLDSARLSKPRRYAVISGRFIYKIADDFRKGAFSDSASSLVYTTLLTFVPLIAIAFALSKAFGVHNYLAPTLLNFLDPIGPKSKDITLSIIGYVDRINVRVLGVVGLAILFYTVTNTIQRIEEAFNGLWQIKKSRGFIQKFHDYLSVLMAGPLLIGISLGITTTLLNHKVVSSFKQIEYLGVVILFLAKLIPFILIIVSFTMLYYLLPNTKVKFRSALVGGCVAGVLWQALSWAFANFLVSGQYSAIYKGFAVLLIFMVWLYFNWLIILIGAKVAFHHQFPATLRLKNDSDMFSERFKYKLALVIMYLIGLSHYNGTKRWTLDSMAGRFGLPVGPVREVIDSLLDKGVILLIRDDMSFTPARDMEAITIMEILSAVGAQPQGHELHGGFMLPIPAINSIMDKMETGMAKGLEGETLKGLVLTGAFMSEAPAAEGKQTSDSSNPEES